MDTPNENSDVAVPDGTYQMIVSVIREKTVGLMCLTGDVGIVIAPRKPFPEDLLRKKLQIRVTIEDDCVVHAELCPYEDSEVEGKNAAAEDCDGKVTVGNEEMPYQSVKMD